MFGDTLRSAFFFAALCLLDVGTRTFWTNRLREHYINPEHNRKHIWQQLSSFPG
jgi:hypothetical protein